MLPSRTSIKLDPAHSRAVGFVFAVAGMLAVICLELVRWRYLQSITAAGFLPWGDDGFYAHNIPGQALALTSLQPHLIILLAALMAAGAAAMLCIIAAALDMHLPFQVVGKTTLLSCLILPLSTLFIFMAMQTPAVLTINLSQNLLTVTTGVDISLPTVTQFNFYWVRNGKHGHEELGAIINTGQEVNLLAVGSSYDAYEQAQYLAQTLQQYVSSGGTVFPTS